MTPLPSLNCPSSVKLFKCLTIITVRDCCFCHFEPKIMHLALIGAKIVLKRYPPFLAKSLDLRKKGLIIIVRLDILYNFFPDKKIDGMHRKVCISKKYEKKMKNETRIQF